MTIRRFTLLPVLCLALAGAAHAQQPGFWKDQHGKPIPETESMKSKNGFAGSLLATPDEDWEVKWNTPPENAPNFNKADVVPYGKKVFLLSFFVNPLRDAKGNVNVKCDMRITDPTGKVVLDKRDLTCYAGELRGGEYNQHLSGPVIAFSGDPGDPAGTYIVDMTLRDANRHVELPLRTRFQLK